MASIQQAASEVRTMAKKNQNIFSRLTAVFRKPATVSADDYGVTAVTVRRSIACFYVNTPNANQALCFAFSIPEKQTGGSYGSEEI